MDNFFGKLTWYKTEECPICEDGYISILKEDCIDYAHCDFCEGKGFLYIMEKQ